MHDLSNRNTPGDFDQLGTWKIINLMRVIGSVIGWFMVAIAPDDDQTSGICKLLVLFKCILDFCIFENDLYHIHYPRI